MEKQIPVWAYLVAGAVAFGAVGFILFHVNKA
jgi:hypothetical protein